MGICAKNLPIISQPVWVGSSHIVPGSANGNPNVANAVRSNNIYASHFLEKIKEKHKLNRFEATN